MCLLPTSRANLKVFGNSLKIFRVQLSSYHFHLSLLVMLSEKHATATSIASCPTCVK